MLEFAFAWSHSGIEDASSQAKYRFDGMFIKQKYKLMRKVKFFRLCRIIKKTKKKKNHGDLALREK